MGDERQIVAPSDGGPQTATAFTPDGRWVIFNSLNAETRLDIMMAPMDGRTPPVPLVRSKANESGGRVSVDGRWLAYMSDESGRAQVYVAPFSDTQTRWQISPAGGGNARWRRDGKELYYVEGGRRLMVVELSAGSTFEASVPRLLFSQAAPFIDYDVTSDGLRFLFSLSDPEAEAG